MITISEIENLEPGIYDLNGNLLADYNYWEAYGKNHNDVKNNIGIVIIPDDVDEIMSSLFEGCLNLAYVKMPKDLERIEHYAFHECNLEKIELPEKVRYIGSYAFADCQNLQYVYSDTPNYIYIDEGAFLGCNLQAIIYNELEDLEADLGDE